MFIRAGDDSLEIVPLECTPASPQYSGDIRLRIVVLSQGFSGAGTVWVENGKLAQFVQQLAELELHREGIATLESMSPGEFVLHVKAIDRWGHVGLSGRLSQLRNHASESGPYTHIVEFGFGFCSTILPLVLANFRAIEQFTG